MTVAEVESTWRPVSDFPPVEPHGPIEEVWDGVYWVRGSVRMGPGLRIPRNMAIVKDAGDLTVVSSVRLGDEREAELKKIGRVKHVVRIGVHAVQDGPRNVRASAPVRRRPS